MNYERVVEAYVKSPQFQRLAPHTKRLRVISLAHLARHFDGCPVSKITRPMVVECRDRNYHQRGRCRVMLSTLKSVLNHAYDKGWVKANVAAGLGDMPETEPIARWSADEVERFLATAPI